MKKVEALLRSCSLLAISLDMNWKKSFQKIAFTIYRVVEDVFEGRGASRTKVQDWTSLNWLKQSQSLKA